MKKGIWILLLCFLSTICANAQRQYTLKEAESFFLIKKDSVIASIERKEYRLIKQEKGFYLFQKIDENQNEFQVLLTFNKNELIVFDWIELSEYLKQLTSELFDGGYFNNGEETDNDNNNLGIRILVKPSENRLYLTLRER